MTLRCQETSSYVYTPGPDPRGPTREIVSIDARSDGTALTLSCGHVGKFNQAFQYKVGASVHCFQCREVKP